ncbi:hypothetical protein CANARDRAFT_26223 [[Candida] arabinofermentans NRRL YB-2248]|uniref:Uncharacterized protein n=1 Tax=[Candida] arabinofermentans NRRL YB-2248 TaxID=983967 RepID=A0A1E4T8K4_9ASCO|nr:hypothetical protein CANARDRAFT_26223 [[Candida] arabinofermentans NRRL YB-2248]
MDSEQDITEPFPIPTSTSNKRSTQEPPSQSQSHTPRRETFNLFDKLRDAYLTQLTTLMNEVLSGFSALDQSLEDVAVISKDFVNLQNTWRSFYDPVQIEKSLRQQEEEEEEYERKQRENEIISEARSHDDLASGGGGATRSSFPISDIGVDTSIVPVEDDVHERELEREREQVQVQEHEKQESHNDDGEDGNEDGNEDDDNNKESSFQFEGRMSNIFIN